MRTVGPMGSEFSDFSVLGEYEISVSHDGKTGRKTYTLGKAGEPLVVQLD